MIEGFRIKKLERNSYTICGLREEGKAEVVIKVFYYKHPRLPCIALVSSDFILFYSRNGCNEPRSDGTYTGVSTRTIFLTTLTPSETPSNISQAPEHGGRHSPKNVSWITGVSSTSLYCLHVKGHRLRALSKTE
ncbi:hypothetical protein EVAR_13156_1 [Eumeta japonica]|uniref:Uncharacterized protein n=1 Tax=Eumeta variegata TaxID=151549 RepID=A0A4C1U9Q1_EUMVA|nr:hypothetical protein EVAR_13156_1 [Eumeta japonica]